MITNSKMGFIYHYITDTETLQTIYNIMLKRNNYKAPDTSKHLKVRIFTPDRFDDTQVYVDITEFLYDTQYLMKKDKLITEIQYNRNYLLNELLNEIN